MSFVDSRLLILLRHAKAELPVPGRADAERPLSARGVADALAAGGWLAAQSPAPGLVLCSPALRTRETWAAVEKGRQAAGYAGEPATVALVPGLYTDGVDALLELLVEIPDEVATLVVVGHNPTVSIVSAVLDPEGGSGAGLRTAGLAVHGVPGTWKDCGRGAAHLIRSYTARATEIP